MAAEAVPRDEREKARSLFFQAEDGIRDLIVTGVQTCALPICGGRHDGLAAGAPAGGARLADARAASKVPPFHPKGLEGEERAAAAGKWRAGRGGPRKKGGKPPLTPPLRFL